MPHYLHSILHANIPHPIPYPTVWNQNLEKGLEIARSILNSQPIPFPTVWNQDLEKSLEIITLADIATSPTTVTPQCGIRIWKRVLKSCDLKCSMLIYLNPPIPYPTVWNQDLEKGLPHASLFIFNTACRYTSCLNGSLHSTSREVFKEPKYMSTP